MMDCTEACSLVDSWDAGGDLPESRLGDFKAHVLSCQSCSPRFSSLLPLLERDTGKGFVAPPGLAVSSGELGSGVMRAIGRRSPRRAWLPAAAAAIFVAGIGLGLVVGRGERSDMIAVQFVLDAPEASRVSLVGDFNTWSSETNLMYRSSPGKPWEVRLKLPKDRMYVYNFVIDGKLWVADPTAAEKVDDGFGGSSSLLRL
ncbi:MAG: isoamylase early set domain-containing protein [Spirochaetota bacterium]